MDRRIQTAVLGRAMVSAVDPLDQGRIAEARARCVDAATHRITAQATGLPQRITHQGSN